MSGSRDRSARIWQPEIGRLVRILKHDAEVLDVAWPDDVVTASADGRLRVFEAGSDAVRKDFDAGGRIFGVAAKGASLLAAAGDLRTFDR